MSVTPERFVERLEARLRPGPGAPSESRRAVLGKLLPHGGFDDVATIGRTECSSEAGREEVEAKAVEAVEARSSAGPGGTPGTCTESLCEHGIGAVGELW